MKTTSRCLVLVVFFATLMTGACSKFESNSQQNNASVPVTTQQPQPSSDGATSGFDFTVDLAGLSKSTIVIKTSKGTLKLKLYSNDAPQSTRRFVELIKNKFYDGLTFHRVINNFIVQTGDPKSKNKEDPSIGPNGSGQKLKAEFNGRKHVRGTVALALGRDPDSADSQFYICLGTFNQLDEKDTVIGQVTDFGDKSSGQDVLARLKQWDEVTEIKIEP